MRRGSLKARAWAAAGAAMFLMAACRSGTPASPSALVDGRWTGFIVHSEAGDGSVVLELQQSGRSVSGTWSAEYPRSGFDAAGSIGGTVAGIAASLFLSPGAPINCGAGMTLSGTLALDASISGNRLSGPWVAFTCEGVANGRIDVTRTP